MKIYSALRTLICVLSFLIAPCKVFSEALNIAQVPLSVGIPVEPNFMVTLDDSSGMEKAWIPDVLGKLASAAPAPNDPVLGQEVKFSAQTNLIYYDPTKTYAPWVAQDGTSCPNVDYTHVPYFPDGSSSSTAALWECQNGTGIAFPPSGSSAVFADFSKGVPAAYPHAAAMPFSAEGYPSYWIYLGLWPNADPGILGTDTLCLGGEGYPSITPDVCDPRSYFPVVVYPQGSYSVAGGVTSALSANLATQVNYFTGNGRQVPFPLSYLNSNAGTILSQYQSNILGKEDRTQRIDCQNPNDPLPDPPNSKNSCTWQQEMTNFANWYVYYRTRKQVARAVFGQALAPSLTGSLPLSLRLGYARTNWRGKKTCTGASCATYDDANWQSLTDSSGSIGTVKLGVREVTNASGNANRQTFFYNNLYCDNPDDCSQTYTPSAQTELRRAMDDVGRYFSLTGNSGPWSNDPTTQTSTAQLACRKNYQVLLTDGYSMDTSTADYPPSVGNVDGADGPTYIRYDNYQLANPAAPPYRDDYADTLADYAMKYWVDDLRPDLPNEVPINTLDNSLNADKAFWHHLVNFIVGMGAYGTLAPDSLDASGNITQSQDSLGLFAGSKSWPNPGPSILSDTYAPRMDALWHAAINSRGFFFNAQNGKAGLAEALNKNLQTGVFGAVGSASSAATNSATLSGGSALYLATFNSEDWSGNLQAIQINADGSLGSLLWDASSILAARLESSPTAFQQRKVFSWNFTKIGFGGNGLPYNGFDFSQSASLSPSQDNGIKGSDSRAQPFLDYIMGDRSNEKTIVNGMATGEFRSRTVTINGQSFWRPLGDIVNSNPLFVGGEDYGYTTLPGQEGSTYQAFLDGKNKSVNNVAPRPQMVYVASNDGMLHGFQAGVWNGSSSSFFYGAGSGNGSELFAYVPGVSIIGTPLNGTGTQLNNRVVQDPLIHQYIVDGSPVAGDAYFSNQWHTILLGTTGAGSESVFALDVTDPANFNNSKVLWEYAHAAKSGIGLESDIGYTMPQPALARLQNGKWAAIVANGYASNPLSSRASKAALFIFDVSKNPKDAGFIMKKFLPCDSYPSACPLDSVTQWDSTLKNVMNNGLSSAIPVDVDGDHKVDFIYAGDLLGNLWKFDMNCPHRDSTTGDDTACGASNWAVANGGAPLFTACDPNRDCTKISGRQPIIGKPQVTGVGPLQTNVIYGNQSQSGSAAVRPSVMVFFGTGKYFETSDATVSATPQVETFYGLWDQNTGNSATDVISGRGSLLQQTVQTNSSPATGDVAGIFRIGDSPLALRVTSNKIPCYNGISASSPAQTCTVQQGWYMDLPSPGERSVDFPRVVNNNILFNTIIPSSDPCIPMGTGWLMELDAITGSRPNTPALDVHGGPLGQPDGKVNSSDMVSYTGTNVPPSGEQSTVGILKAPALVYGNGVYNKYFNSNAGAIMTDANSKPVINPGPSLGRLSWRQLR